MRRRTGASMAAGHWRSVTALVAIALALHPSAAPAQSRNPEDYVLLATQSISADSLTVTDGDVAVLDGIFSSSRGLVARASTIAAPMARLDASDVCEGLLASSSRGGGPACGAPHAFTRPFSSLAAACGFPAPFLPCDPSRPPVIVPRGATVALLPGVYGDVRV